MIDLKGTTVLLTGASDGIGKAAAIYLMEHGAKVAVHYNTNKDAANDMVNRFNNGSFAVKANLEITDDCVKLMETAIAKFNKIDCIILNAGVFLEHSTEDSLNNWLKIWDKTIDINLRSAAIMTKIGIDHFKENKGGRFIYIGSRAVVRGETQEYLGYAASKGGLTSLGRSVARSFGKDNIKSFIIAPGFVRTSMAEQFIDRYGEKRVLDEISLNSLTEPKDLAPLISLMCSGQMDHATGATIDVNAASHIR